MLYTYVNKIINQSIIYADDGQLYLAFSPKDSLSHEEAKEEMMECAKDVTSFLTFNKMKQNDDKI